MLPRTSPPLLAIVGATGTGKSALAVTLAKQFIARGVPAEIISADAMQLYRGMDIGTAKLTSEEMAGITHHQIDVLDPSAEASVSAYQKQVTELIAKLQQAKKIAILVGGSGLYVNSVLYKMNFAPHSAQIRAQLEKLYEQRGLSYLQQLIRTEDPQAAKEIDLRNPRRVVRALEIRRASGESPVTSLPRAPQLLRPTLLVHVLEERQKLVERLDARVEKMWQAGLPTEVAKLKQQGLCESKTASRAIGYAQALAHLDGRLTAAEAIAEVQLLTRRYARRQVSWFKRLPDQLPVTSAAAQTPSQQAALLAAYFAMWRGTAVENAGG